MPYSSSFLVSNFSRTFFSKLAPNQNGFHAQFIRSHSTSPTFFISPKDIHIIHEPKEFFHSLTNLIENAQHRISLSTLYVGSDQIPLMNSILHSLNANKQNPNFSVSILMDGLRGTRGPSNANSVALLLPLIQQHPKKVDIHLFHTPNLSATMKAIVPQRFNESFGLMHIKAYVVDDNVIITGANLNKDYFENRQDRYFLLKNCPALADYVCDLEKTISRLSYKVKLSNGGHRLYDMIGPAIDPAKESRKFITDARIKLEQFQKQYLQFPNNHNEAPSGVNEGKEEMASTTIQPVIQMGCFSIRHEEHLTNSLLLKSTQDKNVTSIYMTSGYFNITQDYQQCFLQAKCNDISLLVASPQANGFYEAKDISKYIPDAYTYLEKLFLEKVRICNNHISLHEYQRPGWTYHAKGLWLYSMDQQDLVSLPWLTMIGSSNFGYRSRKRDLELQMVISTTDTCLKERMDQERQKLYEHSIKVDLEHLLQRCQEMKPWIKIATRVIRSML